MIEQLALWQLAALSGLGLLAGFLNVMSGGGSMLIVPVMVFMGIPGPVVNGTLRVAILAQNISAAIAFFRHGYSEFRLSLSLAACALPGAVIGAMMGVQLSGAWFNRTVALIMIGVMLIMYFDWRDKKRRALLSQNVSESAPATGPGTAPGPGGRREYSREQLLWGHLLMVGAGFYGGFIQVGVGFILTPILARVLGIDLVRTNMHKVFIIACYTVPALAVFAAQVQILWLAGLALALGNSIGGWVSASFQARRGEGVVRVVLNIVLAVFVVKLLFFP